MSRCLSTEDTNEHSMPVSEILIVGDCWAPHSCVYLDVEIEYDHQGSLFPIVHNLELQYFTVGMGANNKFPPESSWPVDKLCRDRPRVGWNFRNIYCLAKSRVSTANFHPKICAIINHRFWNLGQGNPSQQWYVCTQWLRGQGREQKQEIWISVAEKSTVFLGVSLSFGIFAIKHYIYHNN